MHSDKPVRTPEQDRFQRYEFAKRIATTILKRQSHDSLTIGLYGRWGEGKTSVIEFVHGELEDKAICIRFNPWQFVDEHQLLNQFFVQLAETLSVKLTNWKDDVSDAVKRYGGFLGSIPGVPISEKATEAFGGLFTKTNLQEQRRILSETLAQAEKPIVIFIDDIDRLSSAQIQAIFKLVKSTADFPNTVYFLSLDPQRVSDALEPMVGNGKAYLEKIIQVPLTLPKAQSTALRQYTYSLIEASLQQSELLAINDDFVYFREHFEAHLAAFLQLPRDAARLSNSLSFVIPLLEGEVRVSDLLLLEAIKVLLPELYQSVREASATYLSVYNEYGVRTDYNEQELKKKEAKETIDAHLAFIPTKKRKSVLDLLKLLFPQLDGLYSNITYAGDDRYKKWHQQKRLCSGQHFDRYFSYAVAEDDISDRRFAELLVAANIQSPETALQVFDQAFLNVDAHALAYKLMFYDTMLSPLQTAQLARALCRHGQDFYAYDGSNLNTRRFTMHLIKKYIHGQNEQERTVLACELTNICLPIDMAFSLYDRLWEIDRLGSDDNHTLSLEQLKQVEATLLSRIYNHAALSNLFTAFNDAGVRLFLYGLVQHGHNLIDLKARMMRYLADDPSACLRIISVVAPTIYTTRLERREPSREEIKIELKDEDYALLEAIIDIDRLYQRTVTTYGNQIYVARQDDSPYPELSDLELIGQFQQMYRSRTADVV